MLVLEFEIPATVPVINDIIAKEANCAYTLKSTNEDMATFCGELINEYYSGDGAVKEMFSATVNIDDVNSWGWVLPLNLKVKEELIGILALILDFRV